MKNGFQLLTDLEKCPHCGAERSGVRIDCYGGKRSESQSFRCEYSQSKEAGNKAMHEFACEKSVAGQQLKALEVLVLDCFRQVLGDIDGLKKLPKERYTDDPAKQLLSKIEWHIKQFMKWGH